MQQEQKTQESEYQFPYHYIPDFRQGFGQCVSWIWAKQYLSAIEFLIDYVGDAGRDAETIIDLGCGDGRIASELAISFPSKNIKGVDYSKRAISLARALSPHVNFECVDILDDDISLNADLITLVEVFEHIPIPQCEEFVRSVARILSSSGLLVITVPHANNPVSAKHFQHFTTSRLLGYFEPYFEVVDMQYIQKSSKLLRLLNLLFDNSFYTVRNQRLNNAFYRFYKKYYFNAREEECSRIFLALRKR